MDIVNVLLSILGIGFLIFVHELGHFLAAKKVGIRVETFALGFQPTIAGWKARIFAMKRGDTEYVIGLLPFGGYVKMAGEELEDPRTGASDEYASKTPAQRALVLVAGATMNLIFGLILFVIAFTMGVSFPSTELGMVIAEGPAWEAGLRAGDRVLTVSGDEKRDFTDLSTSIALSSRDAVLPVTYERTLADGSTELRETELRPRLNRGRGMLEVGFSTAIAPRVSAVIPGSAAAEAGLRDGDRFVAITLEGSGHRVELPRSWSFDAQNEALRSFVRHEEGGAVEFRVRGASEDTAARDTGAKDTAARDTAERTVRVELASLEKTGRARLGIHTGGALRVRAVQPGSPLGEFFPVGATVTTLGGAPVHTIDLWTILTRSSAEDGTIRVGFADGAERDVPREALLSGFSNPGGGEVVFVGESPTITTVPAGTLAEELGLAAGDVVTEIGGAPVGQLAALFGLVEPGEAVTWLRGGETRTATVPEGGRPRSLGAEVTAPVLAVHVQAGSAAEEAGVRAGDLLVAIAGETITDQDQFLDRAGKASDKDEPITLSVERDGETLELSITPAPTDRSLGLMFGPDLVEIRTSMGGAIGEGWNQSLVWGNRIFLMLGSLARRDVSAKNLAGPVGIIHIGKKVADEGFSKLIFVLAMISINLGVFNLLPFPILDGGHLFFLLIEKLKGSPVDERIQGYAHLGAFFILIGLAIFVTYHDISRLFG